MKKVLISMMLVILTLCLFVSCKEVEPKGKTGTIYYQEGKSITDTGYWTVIKCDGKGYLVQYFGDSFVIKKTFNFTNGTTDLGNSFSVTINGDNISVNDPYDTILFPENDSITITSDITNSGFSFEYNGVTYTVNPNTPS